MAKAIHMMLRALDEDRSVAFYRRALQFEVTERLEFDDFILIYMRGAETDFELELTINKGRTEPYELGDGYGHLAVAVDDLDSTHRNLTQSGLNPRDIVEFERNGKLLARFFFMQDPDGYKIEVLQKHGRYR